MSDFQPGWHATSGPDAQGNTRMYYFKDRNTVTGECYVTSDNRQIHVNSTTRKMQWKDSYRRYDNEVGGEWDNDKPKSADKTKSGGTGSGKSPCEDASLACSICDQRGFPILPLRYAVARSDRGAKAPLLQSPFGSGVNGISLPSDQAHYTLRLLRPGYLYVFNEKRGEWKAYVVAQGGYLLEFDIESKSPPDVGSAMPCARMAQSAASRCVMIPDAKRAGKVWLGFTDTAWTKAVLESNRKEAYRERHMQCVDVGSWITKSQQQQDHTAVIDLLESRVGEFAMPLPTSLPGSFTVTSYGAFDYSPHDFSNERKNAKDLVARANAAAKTCSAMMAAIPDPVGITMELASLLSARMQEFLLRPDLARPLAVEGALGSLEKTIKDQGELDAIRKAQTDAVRMMDPGYMAAGDGGGSARAGMALAEAFNPSLAKQREKMQEALSKITPSQMNEASDDAWAKYLKKLNTPSRERWRKTYQAQLSAFDNKTIIPLANAHKLWLSGKSSASCFECNYDDQDIHSGQGYVDTLVLCIQDTQQNKICMDLYSQWICAKSIDRENLILRAFNFNQEALLAQIDKHVPATGLDPNSLKTMPWDALIAGYEKALSVLAAGGKDAVVRLLAAVGGPMMGMVDKALDRGIGPALISMGLVARSPVVVAEWSGSKAQAIQELIMRMQALNPKIGNADKNKLANAIDLEMRRANIRGVPLHKQGKFHFIILGNEAVVKDFPSNVAGKFNPEKRFAEALIITEAERLEKTQLRWKGLMSTNVRLGLVTSILQVVALGKLGADVDKSMTHERPENVWRYRAGVTALVGTSSGLVNAWMENSAVAASKLARFMPTWLSKTFGILGKTAGFAAGAIMAFWDGYRGTQEWSEGNKGVAILYFVSAGAGFIAMGMFAGWFGAAILGVSSTGIGIILVAIAILIAVLIELFKDNKLQDWIERCYFGKFDKKDRYTDLKVEMEQLKAALEG